MRSSHTSTGSMCPSTRPPGGRRGLRLPATWLTTHHLGLRGMTKGGSRLGCFSPLPIALSTG